MEIKWLSYKDALDYLGLKSYTTLQKLIKNDLPVVIVDGTKLISKSDIDEFMQAHKVTTK